jgi:hypothetical protein
MSAEWLIQLFVIPRACRWILDNPRWPRSTGLPLTIAFLALVACYTVYQEQLDRPVAMSFLLLSLISMLGSLYRITFPPSI